MLVGACASSSPAPDRERYARADWAHESLEQAKASCQAEINRPGGTPSMYLCMKAKGYLEK